MTNATIDHLRLDNVAVATHALEMRVSPATTEPDWRDGTALLGLELARSAALVGAVGR